jgi:hypothetical protein
MDLGTRHRHHRHLVHRCGCSATPRPRGSIIGGADRATRRSISRWIEFWPRTGHPQAFEKLANHPWKAYTVLLVAFYLGSICFAIAGALRLLDRGP